MNARYKRLILGMLVFLGMMLMAGRFRVDTTSVPPLPPEIQAGQAKKRAQETLAAEQRRNPYRYDHVKHPDCTGQQTVESLQVLRKQHDDIVSAIGFADARDRYSLRPLQDIGDSLSNHETPECLSHARRALQNAIFNAQGVLVAHADSDINVFDLREEIQKTMQYNMKTAEQEFILVDEALQYP